MEWILIVVLNAYGGSTVHTERFTTLQDCLKIGNYLTENAVLMHRGPAWKHNTIKPVCYPIKKLEPAK